MKEAEQLRQLALIVAMGVLCLPAAADSSRLAPEGWSAQEVRSHWVFTSPDTWSVAHAHRNTAGDLERLAELAARHNQPPDTYLIHDQGTMDALGGLVTLRLYGSWSADFRYIASSVVVPHQEGGYMICRVYAPMLEEEAPAVVSDFLGACHDHANPAGRAD